jgi:hypothetical protein
VCVGSSDYGSEVPTPAESCLIVPTGGPWPAIFNRVGSSENHLTSSLTASFWGSGIYTLSTPPSFAVVLPREKYLHKLLLHSPILPLSKFLSWFELGLRWEKDWGVRLEHLSEKAAMFIERALEASLTIDLHLLLLKLASRRFGVARLSVLSCVCILGSLYHPSFMDFIVSDSILLCGWLSEVKG